MKKISTAVLSGEWVASIRSQNTVRRAVGKTRAEAIGQLILNENVFFKAHECEDEHTWKAVARLEAILDILGPEPMKVKA